VPLADVARAWALRARTGRDPRQARYLTRESLRWVVRHRAVTPWYLVRYARLARLRLTRPHVVTTGMVFLGKDVEVDARPGYGRVVLGRWVHVGDLTRLRAHEGTLRVGDKAVLGRDCTVNCYLDVVVGDACLLADWVYVTDFDHVHTDLAAPIKDQGLVKAPVVVGAGSWLGVRVSVLRGTDLGPGSVVAAHAVARGTYPAGAVVAGVPGRVVRDRAALAQADADRRAALADMDRKHREAVRDVVGVRTGEPGTSR
jgi:acetyltransferase-like isoleucine patch superfamily enzyme